MAEDLAKIHIQTTARGADILSATPANTTRRPRRRPTTASPTAWPPLAADGGRLPQHLRGGEAIRPAHPHPARQDQGSRQRRDRRPFPGPKRAIATITTVDGRSFAETVDHAKGSPQNPMSDDEVIAKFRANASVVMNTAQQDAIIDATWNLETISHMGNYMRLLVKD